MLCYGNKCFAMIPEFMKLFFHAYQKTLSSAAWNDKIPSMKCLNLQQHSHCVSSKISKPCNQNGDEIYYTLETPGFKFPAIYPTHSFYVTEEQQQQLQFSMFRRKNYNNISPTKSQRPNKLIELAVYSYSYSYLKAS